MRVVGLFTMPPTNCSKCHELVTLDGRYLTCASCARSYHLGKSCAGVSASTFKSMSEAKRGQWSCQLCRASVSESVEESLEADSQSDSPSFSAQLAEVNKKIDLLLSLKSSVDSLVQLPAKVDELLSLKSAVHTMEKSVNDVVKSVDFFSKQYDSLLKHVTANDAVIKELKSEVGSLKSSLSVQSDEIQRLRSELNNSEQYSRRSNLEIHGLPCNPNEDLPSMLVDIAEKVGISEFRSSEVDAVHRLPSSRGTIPVVLVRFRAVTTRDRWLSCRTSLGALARERKLPRLFFNENLTQTNSELFWKARSKGKEKQYRYVWVRNANIYAKKTEGAPLVRVNCISDLELIV